MLTHLFSSRQPPFEESGADATLLVVKNLSEFALLTAFILILLTLFVVLVERKFLAYAQRRMGPAIMGRNGAFQIALDLVKLLTKEIFLIPRPSSALAPVFLALLYATQLLFSQNFI
jgi:NADH:ubiquinone oxidoreductase subunit H